MLNRILIVDDIHDVFLEQLRVHKIDYDYLPECTKEEATSCIKDYTGLVIRSKFRVDGSFLQVAKNLRFIARGGAGMDNIDEELALKKNITLINAPEGNRDAVAEHMIGMLLSLLNSLRKGDSEIRNGNWRREPNRGHELGGKTVALIGYGNNGQAMARKLSGFDVNVIAYDKYKTGFTDQYAKEVSMEEVVRQADVLSFHIPLTRETKGMVDKEYLFHFRKPIYLLMGARGGIADMTAILRALEENRIIGAAFDVLPVESFPELGAQEWFGQLIERGDVLLSPHVAGWSVESYYKIGKVLADKVCKFVSNDNT